MKKFGVFAATALVATLAFSPATEARQKYYGQFTSQYGLRGVGDETNPNRFDILQNAGSGGSDYWCAAGEYAIKKLGAPPTARIYLVQPLGKGRLGRNSVGFSLNPNDVPGGQSAGGFTMSITKVGQSWGAEHSRSQCKAPDGRRS